MPELPEVETVVRDLRPLITGAVITGAHCSWARTLRTHSPDGFAEAIQGRRIQGVSRRAKLLVVDLDSGLVMTIHLKMTGQLFVVPAATPPDPYVRLVLELDGGRRELRFRDIRKFGKVGLYARHEATGEPVVEAGAASVFRALGPEPLDDAFTLAVFRRRVRARSGRLKSLLLDQSFVAGIGNIYADEALWAARLHPLRSASSLRPPDERTLYLAIRAVLSEAVERRGSSVDDYTAPEGDGSMQERLLVYQRAGQPCPRCGRPIRRIVVGSRATHFCSWCQRLPATDRKGAAAILRGMVPRPGPGGGERTGRAVPGGRGVRRGRRWTELSGAEGSGAALGLTAEEARLAALRARAARTKAAAATRRARARGAAGQAATTAAGSGSGAAAAQGATTASGSGSGAAAGQGDAAAPHSADRGPDDRRQPGDSALGDNPA